MKTEGQIREKQIELQAQLINAIEAKHTFESAFERKPTEEEDEAMLLAIEKSELQLDVLNWILE